MVSKRVPHCCTLAIGWVAVVGVLNLYSIIYSCIQNTILSEDCLSVYIALSIIFHDMSYNVTLIVILLYFYFYNRLIQFFRKHYYIIISIIKYIYITFYAKSYFF